MSNRVNLTLDVTKTGIQNPLIKVRQGDGGFETLRTTVTSNGEPLDLQGWTVTFMGTTAGNHKIVDANVTIVEAPNGIFDYTPSKAWGMDIGEFKIAYFKFIKGDGTASSANFRVNVIEAVDLTQEEAKDYISVVDATIAEVREHLENSLADVTASVAATSTAASSMSVSVSSVASSAVSEVASAASNASSVASSAVVNVNSTARSAVSDIDAAANTYVKKAGDTMTGGLTGGQVELNSTGDLNNLATSGKYVQTNSANAANWTNRPNNAPTTAFSVDVIGSTDKSAVTQIYYANTTGRMWVRTLVSSGTYTQWIELANDANVVHNTGNDTIAGDKTFVGNVNFGGDTDWIVVSISTNGTGEIRYRRRFGFVELYAWYNPSTTGTATIKPLTLPTGFRPTGDIRELGMNGGSFNATSARMSIGTNGAIEIGAEPSFYAGTTVRLHTMFSVS